MIAKFKDRKKTWIFIGLLAFLGIMKTRPEEGMDYLAYGNWEFYFFIIVFSYIIMRFITLEKEEKNE